MTVTNAILGSLVAMIAGVRDTIDEVSIELSRRRSNGRQWNDRFRRTSQVIRYVPRCSGVLRVGIRVIAELYIVGPRRLRVDELRLIMMRAHRGMRDACVEIVLGQGSPRSGNSSKRGDSVLPSLEGGVGREALKGKTPRREGTRCYRPSKGEWEGKPSKGKLLEGRGLRSTVPRRGNGKSGPSKGWSELVCAGVALRRAKQAAVSQLAARAMERALIVGRASRDNGRDATYRMIDD